jgi:hypothetical protein
MAGYFSFVAFFLLLDWVIFAPSEIYGPIWLQGVHIVRNNIGNRMYGDGKIACGREFTAETQSIDQLFKRSTYTKPETTYVIIKQDVIMFFQAGPVLLKFTARPKFTYRR